MSLASIIAGAVEAAQQAAGVDLIYARGEGSAEVLAIPGKTDVDAFELPGIGIPFHYVDFIVKASEIDFGSGAVEPQAGDTLTDGDLVYEVMEARGSKCFRYMYPARSFVRIHTKLIRTQRN